MAEEESPSYPSSQSRTELETHQSRHCTSGMGLEGSKILP